MWGGIELRELETIFVLADELHFGRTAQRLGVSTAHVSQTVRHIERRLGGQLFERTSRRVELTLLGETLVENLRPLVTELGRLLGETAAMAAGLTGPLRIAHIMTVEGVARLDEVCAEFERRVPGVKIHRLRFDILDYVAALRRDQVDIWLTWWPSPAPENDTDLGLVCGPPLAEQPAVLLVGRSHPLAQRDSISLDDLVEHPLIDLPEAWVIGSEDLKLFRERWLPTTTPSGKQVSRVREPEWHGHFHELATILERGTLGWLTIASFLDTVAMPRTVTAVPVRDAAPFVLVPWWLADRETPAITAFAAIIDNTPTMSPPALAPRATPLPLRRSCGGDAGQSSRRAAPADAATAAPATASCAGSAAAASTWRSCSSTTSSPRGPRRASSSSRCSTTPSGSSCPSGTRSPPRPARPGRIPPRPPQQRDQRGDRRAPRDRAPPRGGMSRGGRRVQSAVHIRLTVVSDDAVDRLLSTRDSRRNREEEPH